MIELNKIYCENCLDTMERMPDDFVDLIIIDPPYSGLANKSKSGTRMLQEGNHIIYDDMSERVFLLFIKVIFKECYRILKLGGHLYCFTDWKQMRNMSDVLELSSLKIVNLICWDKCHFGLGSGYRPQSEYILLFSKGLPKTFNLKNIGNVLKFPRVKESLHPHQKPEELIDIFITNSTNEGDLIYDPMCGSGTVPKMATRLNRRWIASEISQKYYDISERRIKNEQSILKLKLVA